MDDTGSRPTTPTNPPPPTDPTVPGAREFLEENVFVDVQGNVGDEDLVFYYRALPGAKSLKVKLKGGTGDANLYAYTENGVCQEETPGTNNEECLFVEYMFREVIEIRVRAAKDFTGAKLKARSFFE